MKVEIQANGFKATGIQELIEVFEKAAAILFPDSTVRHFYYGDKLDMADIIISDGRYGGFHISENSIKLEGYECKQEDLNKLQQMTYNDWLYEDGNIYNII